MLFLLALYTVCDALLRGKLIEVMRSLLSATVCTLDLSKRNEIKLRFNSLH